MDNRSWLEQQLHQAKEEVQSWKEDKKSSMRFGASTMPSNNGKPRDLPRKPEIQEDKTR
jgi:hypothetical protein